MHTTSTEAGTNTIDTGLRRDLVYNDLSAFRDTVLDGWRLVQRDVCAVTGSSSDG